MILTSLIEYCHVWDWRFGSILIGLLFFIIWQGKNTAELKNQNMFFYWNNREKEVSMWDNIIMLLLIRDEVSFFFKFSRFLERKWRDILRKIRSRSSKIVLLFLRGLLPRSVFQKYFFIFQFGVVWPSLCFCYQETVL